MDNTNNNTDTYQIKIEPKEGFEIDLEKSNFLAGEIIFKKKEGKYPSLFEYDKERHGGIANLNLSKKYINKLEILDVLLCLRDEYNRIDGVDGKFEFGEINWVIENYENKLDLDCWSFSNRIMHFSKKETAELFLKNFKEQLEQIKEFL